MAGSDIDRLPPLPLDQLDPQQRAAAQAIIDGPRGALIRSPELMISEPWIHKKGVIRLTRQRIV